MARPRACQSFCQNFSPIGKDKLADAVPIEGSGTLTPISAMSHAFTLAPAPPLAPAVTFTPPIANSATKYSAKNLQQILKTILKARVLAPVS